MGISKKEVKNRKKRGDQSPFWGIVGIKAREVNEGLECHSKRF